MGLTISNLSRGVAGNRREYTATITFDSSYAANGESLRAWDLGLDQIHSLVAEPSSGYVFVYDYTNEKLLAYWTGAITGTITGTGTASGTVSGTTVASGVVGTPSFTITSGALDASGAVGLSALSSAATLNNAAFGGTIASPVGAPSWTGSAATISAAFHPIATAISATLSGGAAATLTEVTGGTNLSAISTYVVAIGI